MYDFPAHGCTKEQNDSSVLSSDNANGRLCQEKLLGSKNIATTVT